MKARNTPIGNRGSMPFIVHNSKGGQVELEVERDKQNRYIAKDVVLPLRCVLQRGRRRVSLPQVRDEVEWAKGESRRLSPLTSDTSISKTKR